MKQKILDNLKHLPTTLAGVGAVLAALPQNDTVAHLVGISPKVAAAITAIGAVGSALVLIFGAGATK
jgi:hypothetical protein